MFYNTRGRGTGTMTPFESGKISQAELEILQKNLIDKEKQIHVQTQALREKLQELEAREENLAKEKSAAVDITILLSSILSSFKRDVGSLNKLSEQIEQLNMFCGAIDSQEFQSASGRCGNFSVKFSEILYINNSSQNEILEDRVDLTIRTIITHRSP